MRCWTLRVGGLVAAVVVGGMLAGCSGADSAASGSAVAPASTTSAAQTTTGLVSSPESVVSPSPSVTTGAVTTASPVQPTISSAVVETADDVDAELYREAGAYYAFDSPSGNIKCLLDSAFDVDHPAVRSDPSVMCLVQEHEWVGDPAPSADLCAEPYSWIGDAVAVTADGVVAGVCLSGLPTDGDNRVLEYGTSITVGPVHCSSAEAGIACSDSRVSGGFTVARGALTRQGPTPGWIQAGGPDSSGTNGTSSVGAFAGQWSSKFTSVTISADGSGTLELTVPCCKSATYPVTVAGSDTSATITVVGSPTIVGDYSPDLAVGATMTFTWADGAHGAVITGRFGNAERDLFLCSPQAQDERCEL